MKRENKIEGLQISQLEAEFKREKHKHRYRTVLKSTISTLIVVAAVAVLAATLWMPVLQIYGNSMTPTLKEGQIIVSLKGSNLEQGDLVAFYVGNKLLVKRVIAESGEWFDITEEGVVFVNGKELDEPYLQEKAYGECDIEHPYQEPETRYYLMGDHRTSSVDSRSSVIGCIDKEQIVGKIVFCVWPPEDFGVCKKKRGISMNDQLRKTVEKFYKEYLRKKRWKLAVNVMGCVVVFCTTYALILPAITMQKDTICGYEEHLHGEECYISAPTVEMF